MPRIRQLDIPPSIEDDTVFGPISDALSAAGFATGKPQIIQTDRKDHI